VEDNRGKTPLDYASHYNPIAFVRMLIYLRDNGFEDEVQSLLVIPGDGRDTPLHVLAKNPFAPADTIAALLELIMEAAICRDDEGMSPLGYAGEYNVEGFVSMIAVLCIHRNSTALMVQNKALENLKKRKILQE